MPFDLLKLSELGVGTLLSAAGVAVLWYVAAKAFPDAVNKLAEAMRSLTVQQRKERTLLRKWLAKQDADAERRAAEQSAESKRQHAEIMGELRRPKETRQEGRA